MQSKLQEVVERLLSDETYAPVIREVALEFHRGFEEILTEALTSNPGETIDGAAILAILMNLMRTISEQPTHQRSSVVPRMNRLPSTRIENGRPNSD